MAKVLPLIRCSVLLEEEKVRKLMKTLKVKTESEAIRTVIDDRLFADEVMQHVRAGIVKLTYGEATLSQAGGKGDAHLRDPRPRVPSLSATSGSVRPSVADRLSPPTGAGRDGNETQWRHEPIKSVGRGRAT
jgi:hypothetical protein